jgi:hypothetical protein
MKAIFHTFCTVFFFALLKIFLLFAALLFIAFSPTASFFALAAYALVSFIFVEMLNDEASEQNPNKDTH